MNPIGMESVLVRKPPKSMKGITHMGAALTATCTSLKIHPASRPRLTPQSDTIIVSRMNISGFSEL